MIIDNSSTSLRFLKSSTKKSKKSLKYLKYYISNITATLKCLIMYNKHNITIIILYTSHYHRAFVWLSLYTNFCLMKYDLVVIYNHF